jgi:hypothetical protein
MSETPEERFICSTCPAHEDQSSKVDTMWGAGKVLLVVASLVFGGLFTLIMDTRSDAKEHVKIKNIKIEAIERESLARDRAIEARFISTTAILVRNDSNTERAFSELSINLKRLMKAQGVDYLEPGSIYRNGE